MQSIKLRCKLSEMLHEWNMPSMQPGLFFNQCEHLFSESDIGREHSHQLHLGNRSLELCDMCIWVQFAGGLLLSDLCEFTQLPELFGPAGANDLPDLPVVVFYRAFGKLHFDEPDQ